MNGENHLNEGYRLLKLYFREFLRELAFLTVRLISTVRELPSHIYLSADRFDPITSIYVHANLLSRNINWDCRIRLLRLLNV